MKNADIPDIVDLVSSCKDVFWSNQDTATDVVVGRSKDNDHPGEFTKLSLSWIESVFRCRDRLGGSASADKFCRWWRGWREGVVGAAVLESRIGTTNSWRWLCDYKFNCR